MIKQNYQRLAVIPALIGSSLAISSAAVPAAYTTAIEGAVTDATSMATSTFVLLVGMSVVVLLGGLAIKFVKKGRSAA